MQFYYFLIPLTLSFPIQLPSLPTPNQLSPSITHQFHQALSTFTTTPTFTNFNHLTNLLKLLQSTIPTTTTNNPSYNPNYIEEITRQKRNELDRVLNQQEKQRLEESLFESRVKGDEESMNGLRESVREIESKGVDLSERKSLSEWRTGESKVAINTNVNSNSDSVTLKKAKAQETITFDEWWKSQEKLFKEEAAMKQTETIANSKTSSQLERDLESARPIKSNYNEWKAKQESKATPTELSKETKESMESRTFDEKQLYALLDSYLHTKA